ncbi:MAG TPA: glycosyltransferase [Candidatus Kapabacteria bacterium]|jgi:glycosyltransferase involved in cell wall biosynthesis
MKILYVGHTYTVRANQAKIAALARLPGVEIALVTPHAWQGPLYKNRADRFEGFSAENVHHHIVPAVGIGKESGFLYSPRISRIIKEFQPDIIHVEQGTYALSYAQILWAAKRYAPKARAIFFTWWNLPYELHGIKQRAESFNFAHSATAIAGNQAAKEILWERGFHRPIHVLPQLGIDLPASNDRRENDHKERFRIGYAGRIASEKGVLDLVHAAARMEHREKSELYFVGTGGELERVKQEAGNNAISLMHHTAVRNESLPEHLATMDVLVLPSRSTPEWVEQFGHILLEAMAAGIPVIGSSSGEIPNVIGDAGMIFREGNTEELAADLDRLFANPGERNVYASLGKQRIAQHFTHEKIAKAQKEIYDGMMREGMPVVSLNGTIAS